MFASLVDEEAPRIQALKKHVSDFESKVKDLKELRGFNISPRRVRSEVLAGTLDIAKKLSELSEQPESAEKQNNAAAQSSPMLAKLLAKKKAEEKKNESSNELKEVASLANGYIGALTILNTRACQILKNDLKNLTAYYVPFLKPEDVALHVTDKELKQMDLSVLESFTPDQLAKIANISILCFEGELKPEASTFDASTLGKYWFIANAQGLSLIRNEASNIIYGPYEQLVKPQVNNDQDGKSLRRMSMSILGGEVVRILQEKKYAEENKTKQIWSWDTPDTGGFMFMLECCSPQTLEAIKKDTTLFNLLTARQQKIVREGETLHPFIIDPSTVTADDIVYLQPDLIGCFTVRTLFGLRREVVEKLNIYQIKAIPQAVIDAIQDTAGSFSTLKEKHKLIHQIDQDFSELSEEKKIGEILTKITSYSDIKKYFDDSLTIRLKAGQKVRTEVLGNMPLAFMTQWMDKVPQDQREYLKGKVVNQTFRNGKEISADDVKYVTEDTMKDILSCVGSLSDKALNAFSRKQLVAMDKKYWKCASRGNLKSLIGLQKRCDFIDLLEDTLLANIDFHEFIKDLQTTAQEFINTQIVESLKAGKEVRKDYLAYASEEVLKQEGFYDKLLEDVKRYIQEQKRKHILLQDPKQVTVEDVHLFSGDDIKNVNVYWIQALRSEVLEKLSLEQVMAFNNEEVMEIDVSNEALEQLACKVAAIEMVKNVRLGRVQKVTDDELELIKTVPADFMKSLACKYAHDEKLTSLFQLIFGEQEFAALKASIESEASSQQ